MLGPEHISTLDTVNSLGLLYKEQGKLAEAEEMHQWVLQRQENALGPMYISTLNTVNNLGFVYMQQGKLTEAEQMFQRVLRAPEKALDRMKGDNQFMKCHRAAVLRLSIIPPTASRALLTEVPTIQEVYHLQGVLPNSSRLTENSSISHISKVESFFLL